MVRAGDGGLHDPAGDGVYIEVLMESLLLLMGLIGMWLLMQLVILPRLGFDT
jgi:hypothetical protein